MMLRALMLMGAVFGVASTAYASHDGQEDACHDAAVIMCDNFENRATGNGDMGRAIYKNDGWALSTFDSNGPRVISTAGGVYDGSHALQLTYPDGNNTGGGFLDISLTSSSTIYIRWYTKWSSNFLVSYVANKHYELTTTGGHDMHIMWMDGSANTGLDRATSQPCNALGWVAWFPCQNAGATVTFVNDTWYCLEERLTMNTSGGATDGTLEGWVDGVKIFNYPNQKLDDSTFSINKLLVSGYWNCYSGGSGSEACSSPEDVHPLMYRYHDNIVVSTQPIGCLSGGGGGSSTGGSMDVRRHSSDLIFVSGR